MPDIVIRIKGPRTLEDGVNYLVLSVETAVTPAYVDFTGTAHSFNVMTVIHKPHHV
jgi:hypothetical protein